MSATVIHGDCLDVMRGLEAESIDAPITDPPYGLKFMGKDWDRGVPGVPYWTEALRVTKPGGYLLAFGGTRTYHRLACAIEDAGWEIHDCLSWLYGSGFPKHASKLKPAWEPIILARRPAPRATPLNIDACRIGLEEGADTAREQRQQSNRVTWEGGTASGFKADHVQPIYNPSGRWPANVVLDEESARLVDEQSGERGGGSFSVGASRKPRISREQYGDMVQSHIGVDNYGDTGGASRFYYVAKASRAEREAGLESLNQKPGGSNAKGFTDDVARGLDRNRPVANHHPTVKPVDLMRWLVRLVTPPGGTVLDPFAGSGSTGVAAIAEARSFIGIEREEEYAAIARARLTEAQGPLFADGAA